jgi:hypothetical protein
MVRVTIRAIVSNRFRVRLGLGLELYLELRLFLGLED